MLSESLFSSYVERRTLDWIYKCPWEHRVEIKTCCVMEMHHLCSTLHLPQWDSSGRYHHGGWYASWSWSVFRQLFSRAAGVELKFLCTSLAVDTQLIKKQSIKPHCLNIPDTLLVSTMLFYAHNPKIVILLHHSCFPSLHFFASAICRWNVENVWC